MLQVTLLTVIESSKPRGLAFNQVKRIGQRDVISGLMSPDGVAILCIFPNSYAATVNRTHGRVAPTSGTFLKDALPSELHGRS